MALADGILGKDGEQTAEISKCSGACCEPGRYKISVGPVVRYWCGRMGCIRDITESIILEAERLNIHGFSGY